MLGAPLVIVRHRHRTLWLVLFWVGLVAAGTLWGISLAPLVQPSAKTCCHPPQLEIRHKVRLGTCDQLTPLGQANPDVKPSRCDNPTLAQIALRIASGACGMASVLLSAIVGWIRVYEQVRQDEKQARSKNAATRAAAVDQLRAATRRTNVWHALDVTLFATALVLFSLWGVGWSLAASMGAMAALLVWYWLAAPLHSPHLNKPVVVVMAFAFVYIHQILLPIFRWWHCCDRGHARQCKERRTPCDDPTAIDSPAHWPASIWHAYVALLIMNVLIVVLVVVRTVLGQRLWQRKLDAWLATTKT